MKIKHAIVLTRAAIVAALYVALTYALMSFSYGPIQIRIGEGLTMLPLLYPETVFALFLGCLLANLGSPYGAYDIGIGSVTTLLAAIATFFIGKYVKNKPLKIILGGLPPVLFNAFLLPLMWLLFGLDAGYFANVLPILGTQAIFVYAVGTPLYLLCDRLSAKGVKGFEVLPVFEYKKKTPDPEKGTTETVNVEQENKESENTEKDTDIK